jgi:CheY-like chemotaxis protein
MGSRIQVAIADDNEFIRAMLRRLVARAQDMQILPTVEDDAGRYASGHGRDRCADLALDIPNMGGLEALRRICTVAPDVRVIIHSNHFPDKAAAAIVDAVAARTCRSRAPLICWFSPCATPRRPERARSLAELTGYCGTLDCSAPRAVRHRANRVSDLP